MNPPGHLRRRPPPSPQRFWNYRFDMGLPWGVIVVTTGEEMGSEELVAMHDALRQAMNGSIDVPALRRAGL